MPASGAPRRRHAGPQGGRAPPRSRPGHAGAGLRAAARGWPCGGHDERSPGGAQRGKRGGFRSLDDRAMRRGGREDGPCAQSETALLDTIRELAALAGMDEEGALRVYVPLLEQTVGNARALGVAAALTGPATRGDAGTIAAHLDALARSAPGTRPVYVALMARQVEIAEQRGALSPERAQLLRTALAGVG